MFWQNIRISNRIYTNIILIKSGKKTSKNSFGNLIKKSTSAFGRFQFSVEKAYNVKIFTWHLIAIFTVSLTTSIPFLCPATRGRQRFFAHLPLPSIIIATLVGVLFFSFFFCFFLK